MSRSTKFCLHTSRVLSCPFHSSLLLSFALLSSLSELHHIENNVFRERPCISEAHVQGSAMWLARGSGNPNIEQVSRILVSEWARSNLRVVRPTQGSPQWRENEKSRSQKRFVRRGPSGDRHHVRRKTWLQDMIRDGSSGTVERRSQHRLQCSSARPGHNGKTTPASEPRRNMTRHDKNLKARRDKRKDPQEKTQMRSKQKRMQRETTG